MSDNGMVKGMHINLSSAPPKCEPCILRKQTRTPVPKIREGVRSEGVLDVVYIDLTGPQSVQSANGFNYVMNIIDDASSFVYMYLLPLKSSAIKALKEWIPLAERETGPFQGCGGDRGQSHLPSLKPNQARVPIHAMSKLCITATALPSKSLTPLCLPRHRKSSVGTIILTLDVHLQNNGKSQFLLILLCSANFKV